MFKKILVFLTLLVGVLAVVVSRQPDDFRVTRSASFSVPASVVFAQVNNLHQWQSWSPWAKLDPAAKNTFAGPEAGTGASMEWVGNNQVGEGRMTIVESQQDALIRFKLEFEKPFKATHEAEFTFQSEGPQTKVTWSMSGKSNFISKAIGLFMNCDKMVGGQFEQGLANLKSVCEAQAK